jgi:tRNA A37 threonylcarbamoyladenosine dehydratase
LSREPTSRSPDLQRLRDDGYATSVVAGLLVVRDVPSVNAAREVCLGTLVTALTLRGEQTVPPDHHFAWWSGDAPCDAHGRPLDCIIQGPFNRLLPGGIKADLMLCNMPHGREYSDFHELVTGYISLISGHASLLRPGVTARTHRRTTVVDDPESPFRYTDTATARTGLGDVSARLGGGRVGIVGLGGTGSYVLDLIAKTPVRAIHLYDGDVFHQHNAFRAPGAASLDEIEAGRAKVDHFAAIYSRMHTGIFPHAVRLQRGNLELLDAVDFVFLCLDDAGAKQPIIERLERTDRSFIDVGMGVELGPEGMFGLLRTTTSTPEMRAHVRDQSRIPLASAGGADAYSSNIQIADLNALNAAMAVVRWKRLRGFYADGGAEYHSTYDIDGNQVNRADFRQEH